MSDKEVPLVYVGGRLKKAALKASVNYSWDQRKIAAQTLRELPQCWTCGLPDSGEQDYSFFKKYIRLSGNEGSMLVCFCTMECVSQSAQFYVIDDRRHCWSCDKTSPSVEGDVFLERYLRLTIGEEDFLASFCSMDCVYAAYKHIVDPFDDTQPALNATCQETASGEDTPDPQYSPASSDTEAASPEPQQPSQKCWECWRSSIEGVERFVRGWQRPLCHPCAARIDEYIAHRAKNRESLELESLIKPWTLVSPTRCSDQPQKPVRVSSLRNFTPFLTALTEMLGMLEIEHRGGREIRQRMAATVMSPLRGED
jgi:hypothetical protein